MEMWGMGFRWITNVSGGWQVAEQTVGEQPSPCIVRMLWEGWSVPRTLVRSQLAFPDLVLWSILDLHCGYTDMLQEWWFMILCFRMLSLTGRIPRACFEQYSNIHNLQFPSKKGIISVNWTRWWDSYLGAGMRLASMLNFRCSGTGCCRICRRASKVNLKCYFSSLVSMASVMIQFIRDLWLLLWTAFTLWLERNCKSNAWSKWSWNTNSLLWNHLLKLRHLFLGEMVQLMITSDDYFDVPFIMTDICLSCSWVALVPAVLQGRLHLRNGGLHLQKAAVFQNFQLVVRVGAPGATTSTLTAQVRIAPPC